MTAQPPTADTAPEPTERDREARALYEAAVVAFDEGRFEDALRLFRRSYELSERPELLYNVGTAADRLRRNEEALEAFEAYLAARPEADNRANVEARVVVLRRAIEEEANRATPSPILVPTPAPVEERKSKWWVGVLVGGVLLAGAAAVVAIVATRGDDDDFQEPAHDAAFTTLTRW